MDKYRNKFRIESARLQNWDYGWDGAYFITICTQNRECFFGEIRESRFFASELGQIIPKIWFEIPQHFSYVELDGFVVMPNHVHGILVINKTNIVHGGDGGGDGGRDAINRVSTDNQPNNQTTNPSPEKTGGITGKNNPMLNENLSRIIRWYKGRVSFECRKIRVNFAWQSRFHDHIIRDDASYLRIKNYIINNPANWDVDKFHRNNGY